MRFGAVTRLVPFYEICQSQTYSTNHSNNNLLSTHADTDTQPLFWKNKIIEKKILAVFGINMDESLGKNN